MSNGSVAMIVRSTADTRGEVHRRVKAGELRRVTHGVYTTRLDGAIEDVVGAHLWEVVAAVAPGTVVSYRTALQMAPSDEGTVELEGTARILKLPGVVLRITEGPGPLPGDTLLPGGLHLASDARLLLRNLSSSRTSKYGRRTVSEAALEEWFDGKIRSMGAEYPRRLVGQAEALAPALGAEAEMDRLRDLVGRVVGTREGRARSATGRARAAGEPIDRTRVDLFRWLASELRDSPTTLELPTPDPTPDEFRHGAFFDAYFSNYIEGTEFEIQEAEGIVFRGQLPSRRPADSHDLQASYELLSSRKEMLLVGAADTAGYEEFEEVLRERHRILMRGRPEQEPGAFKEVPNRVGGYTFVRPEEVKGTLKAGFEILRSLGSPFDRALFVSFLIAEVHPFNDGNGRMSRLCMNATLLSGGGTRGLVPTSLRTDYLLALKALSNRNSAEPMRQVMLLGQRILNSLPLADLQGSISKLQRMGAFDERPEAGILPAVTPGPSGDPATG
jgi:fido (protein-threonine AMPylation protein)